MKLWFAVLAVFGLCAARPGQAKPLSYVGGLMLMQENDAGGSTVGLDYTLTPRFAAALHLQRHIRGDNILMLGPQINALIKRWNLPDGQGNIFSMTGAGTTISHGEMRPAVWTGLLADYETRQVFASYEVRLTYAKAIERSAWQRARVGWSPIPQDYDALNPWLMVQVDRYDEKHLAGHAHTAREPKTEVTPIVRLIYKGFLMEGGVSLHGKVMFNWVQQF